MRNLSTAMLVFFILLAGPTEVQGQSGFNPKRTDYLWPTNASHYLTSTFGETRSAHFHAALDLKTWGRRGYKVYATRDGKVSRIAVGPSGYGKVLYLKHKDGSYSVYAHLLSFDDELQHFVDSVRLANNYSFEIERFSGWKKQTIEQGEVIGYSGASGIGPPHLHFELRTPSHKPFNPLLTNLTVKDNIPPQITDISVEPLSYRSSINGSNKIYTQKVWGSKPSYQTSDIRIRGPVGLGINVFDQSNDVHNPYAVYKLSMRVDGRQVFKTKVDSFSYKETDQMFIDRVYPLLKKRGEGYERLFVADGNTLPFYNTANNQGKLDLDSGQHDVSITATDYFGNSSSVSFTINISAESTRGINPSAYSSQKTSGKAIQSPHKWNWFPNWVTLSPEQFSTTSMAKYANENISHHQNGWAIPLQQKDPFFINMPNVGPTIFRRSNPNGITFVPTAKGQAFTVIPKHTFYDTVSVGMSVDKSAANSITVDLIPEVVPQRGPLSFYVPKDSTLTNPSTLSFYKRNRFDEGEQWELISTSFTDEYIKGEAESLGSFKLKRDTTAPVVSNPRIQKQPDGQWVILIDADDNLSGINYKQTIISVNGQRGIPEYAPEDNRFVYYHPNFSPTELMNVEIHISDKMGNKKTATFEIIEN